MSIEKFSHPESAFDKLLRDKNADGWEFVAREGLTQTNFSDEAKFEETSFQTEDDIRGSYLEKLKQNDPSGEYEVDLVLDQNTDKLKSLRALSADEEFDKILESLNPADKNYFIFIRKVESPATENLELEKEKTRLEELQETISNAASRVEAEFARTQNSWLECFGSSVFVVETYLSSPKLEVLLSPEQHKMALQRIEELKAKLHELKQQYPEKNDVPPDETKKELLLELNILGEAE